MSSASSHAHEAIANRQTHLFKDSPSYTSIHPCRPYANESIKQYAKAKANDKVDMYK